MTSTHGRSLINKSTLAILKAHRFARRITTEEPRLEDTTPRLLIGKSGGGHGRRLRAVVVRRGSDIQVI